MTLRVTFHSFAFCIPIKFEPGRDRARRYRYPVPLTPWGGGFLSAVPWDCLERLLRLLACLRRSKLPSDSLGLCWHPSILPGGVLPCCFLFRGSQVGPGMRLLPLEAFGNIRGHFGSSHMEHILGISVVEAPRYLCNTQALCVFSFCPLLILQSQPLLGLNE